MVCVTLCGSVMRGQNQTNVHGCTAHLDSYLDVKSANNTWPAAPHLPPEGIMMCATRRGSAMRGLPSLASSMNSQGASSPPMPGAIISIAVMLPEELSAAVGVRPIVRSTHFEGAAMTMRQRCQTPSCTQEAPRR